jgi:hypothetical protein
VPIQQFFYFVEWISLPTQIVRAVTQVRKNNDLVAIPNKIPNSESLTLDDCAPGYGSCGRAINEKENGTGLT